MAEQEKQKTKRELLDERLKAKYPDKEYADDEALYGQINDDYDEYEQEIGGFKDREKRLNELLTKDPRNAQFIADMAKGENPLLNIIKRIGKEDFKALLDDPGKQEEFQKAEQEFIERLAEERKLQEERDKNMKQSLELLSQMQQQRGLSDEQMDAAYDQINKMAHEVLMGIYSEETMDMAFKAINHDSDIESASQEGEVRGRNAKIEEQLRKGQRSSGPQPLASGGTTASETPKRKMNIFEQARLAQG